MPKAGKGGLLGLAMAINVLAAPDAAALLFNPAVRIDNRFQFRGDVDFKGPLTESEVTVGTNWRLTVQQRNVDARPIGVANDIEIFVTHLMPPHGEGEGPLVDPGDFLNVVPGRTVRNRQGKLDVHGFTRPHGPHFDTLRALIIAHPTDVGVSQIRFQADHSPTRTPPPLRIPEPAGVALVGLALVPFLRRTRRRWHSSWSRAESAG
jgi:hypothetical protein